MCIRDSIRTEAYLIRGISAYLGLYHTPYPLMTENEYVNEGDAEKAISLIDVSRIDDNNFEQVTTIHLKSYNQDELMLLLLTLFDNNNEDSLDSSVKPELVNMLDFAKPVSYTHLDVYKRQYYYGTDDSFYKHAKQFVKRKDSIYRVYHDSIKLTQNYMCPTLTASMGIRENQVHLVLDDYGIRRLEGNP